MKYELTFLLNEEKELGNLRDLLKSLEAKLVEEASWGKKSLVYPIKNQYQAVFYNWKIEIEKKKVTELRKKLNYNEKLIRYLLLVSE